LMRDISANIAILDMMRGAPSIYMLYLGYDEVAHHSGPWTSDAFGDLKRLDHTFARLRTVVKEKAPRPYDFIILSDHGQSFGATFLQRYGVSLKELIEQLLPQGTTVAQSIGGDTGATGLQGVAGELANVQQHETSGAIGKAVAKQGQKWAAAGAEASDLAATAAAEASVTAYGSGNAAQVYFDLFPRRILLSELEAAYPGMVDALVQHEGIGVVGGYADDGAPVIIGKHGRRNLHTGEVTGEDPVAQYAPAAGHGAASVEKRVWQMRRVMDFPHAGDLWVISSVYEDGTVAALEELVGSHGGVGGEQTDAFVFHPPDMEVPETRNAIDVFHILDRHRGAPVVEKPVVVEERVADWAPGTMWAGIRRPGVWLSRAIRCMTLDRAAFAEVVADPYMTGPALLIALITVGVTGIARARHFDPLWIAGEFIVWIVTVLAIFGAGYVMTREGNYTKTFRALGFAHSIYIIEAVALFWPLPEVVHLLATVVGLLAAWLGAAVATKTRGVRTLLLPVVLIVVIVLTTTVVGALLAGATFTADTLLRALGMRV
ncbi:MAG: alkaline phosphatase family protein, partial [Caldilineaceae bacterium]|nr:alkaline phosphatase family protein [Caldilineaceae bacterium]